MLKPSFFAHRLFFTVLVFWVCLAACLHGADLAGQEAGFPTPLEFYADAQVSGVGAKLLGRIQAEPFNLVATLIFFAAIVHTFLAGKFRAVSHRLEVECEEMLAGGGAVDLRQLDRKKFLSVVLSILTLKITGSVNL
jgi:hypothetical protein